MLVATSHARSIPVCGSGSDLNMWLLNYSTERLYRAATSADTTKADEVSKPTDFIFVQKRTLQSVAYQGILFGGVQQIQLRTEDRENGDLGAVVP